MTNWNVKEIGSKFQYMKLADLLEKKILKRIYHPGEKLPSLRKLHDQLGLSKTTIFYAYVELEKRGMIESRPRSGYYVKPFTDKPLPSPSFEQNTTFLHKTSIRTLANTIVEALNDPNLLPLGGIIISPKMFPLKSFSRSLKSISHHHIDRIISPGKLEGTLELRHQIAKRFLQEDNIEADDIIITHGCMEALDLCLRAVAKEGDTIAVESPILFEPLSLIEKLGMNALEIPANSESGIDLDHLERALMNHPIQACLLIPNFQNPLGALMPVANKKRLVEMLVKRKIPIIENDINGDLYFGKNRPPTLKSFDKQGLVLYCSSFSKTLAPGLRVGWTIPGKFKETVYELKANLSFYTTN